MNSNALKLALLSVLICPLAVQSAQIDKGPPRLFIPYKDLAGVVDPAGKTVLMDREAFAKLLAAAETNATNSDSLELGQLIMAEYSARIKGESLSLTAALTVQSLSDKPIRVPLHFAELGRSQVSLDGAPAPLGYDNKRYGLPAVLQSHRIPERPGRDHLRELSAAFDRVTEHLANCYERMTPKGERHGG